jgi:hypothetical protein
MKKIAALTTILAAIVVVFLVPGGARVTKASQPAAMNAPLVSAFAVQNLSSATASVTVQFMNTDGTEFTQAGETRQIAPLSLGNFAMPASLPAGWKGSVVVTSDQEVAAITNLMTGAGATPEGFASNIGMGTGAAGYVGETGNTMYLPFILRERNGRNTMFAVQNAGGAATTVTITYYNISGAVVHSLTKNLQPGQSEIRSQSTDDTAFLPAGFMGSVIASATQPLAAVAYDLTDGVIYSYNGIPNPSTTMYLPFMVGNRSNQNTAYFLQNVSNNPANISVRYVGSSPSGPVDVTHTVNIAAKGGWNQGQNTVPGLPAGFLGSATVTSSQQIVGIVNHSYGGFSEIGKKAAYNPVAAGSKNIKLPYVLRNRGNKTQGVIVQNIDNVATNVTFTFTPLAGGANGAALTKTVTIGPKGFWNFGTDWADFAGMQNGAYGVATVTSDNGNIVAIVNTFRTDNLTDDTLGSYNGVNK